MPFCPAQITQRREPELEFGSNVSKPFETDGLASKQATAETRQAAKLGDHTDGQIQFAPLDRWHIPIFMSFIHPDWCEVDFVHPQYPLTRRKKTPLNLSDPHRNLLYTSSEEYVRQNTHTHTLTLSACTLGQRPHTGSTPSHGHTLPFVHCEHAATSIYALPSSHVNLQIPPIILIGAEWESLAVQIQPQG